MKESKFIELLNLYIDQQISPEEAAALEQEIGHDARRRRVYRQYCQMHRACSLVFENFRSQGEPVAPGVVREAGEMVELGVRPRRFAWGYYAAGVAAAACVAFVALQVFVRPVPSAARGVAAVRPAAASPGTAVAAALVRVTAPTPAGSGRETAAFVAQRLVLLSPAESHNSASLVIVGGREPVRPVSTTEAAPRSLRPSIEQFVFEQPSSGNDNLPALHIRQSTDAETEMAAYQFQR